MRWKPSTHPSSFPLDFALTVEQAFAKDQSVPLEREFNDRQAAEDCAEKFRLWRACLRHYADRGGIRCTAIERDYRIVATVTPIAAGGYALYITIKPRVAAIAALALGIDAGG